MRLALIVEYDGTEYHGFQYQDRVPTIQEQIERAISRFTGENVRIKGAGRTDAGVHAEAQVIAFDTASDQEPKRFERALNHHLPEDISIRASYRVGGRFDPRRDALTRRYRYSIINREVRSPLRRRWTLLVRDALDIVTMQEAAKLFLGTHDFSRFSGPPGNAEAGTVRCIVDSVLRRCGDLVTFEVEGNAFLPHQVRRMAGALVDLGRNRMTIDQVGGMLARRPDCGVAHSLPPHGLCLVGVTYSNFPPRNGEIQ